MPSREAGRPQRASTRRASVRNGKSPRPAPEYLSSRPVEKLFGFAQVGGSESLFESTKNRREQGMRLGSATRLPPQPEKARGDPQFPRRRLLLASQVQRLPQPPLRLAGGERRSLLQREFTTDSKKFRQ